MHERSYKMNQNNVVSDITVELLVPAEPSAADEVRAVVDLLDNADIEYTKTEVSETARVRMAFGSWELVGKAAIGEFVHWQQSKRDARQ